MTRGRLVVHGHFYQPNRTDPFTGRIARAPAAAPFHDWNERINAECYRPNAERGNLDRISFDLGPTLASWLRTADEPTYRAFEAAGSNAMAQPFHHTILPLASLAERRTEIRWGLRDFEIRYGHRPLGMWLPETAVDLATLRLLAEHGVRYTILAPWQAADASIDTRRLYRVDVGGGRSIGVAFYDGGLSAAVSFDAEATADADTFIRDRLIPRFGMPAAEQQALLAHMGHPDDPHDPAIAGSAGGSATATSPIVVVATDGELYGHHQPFRDLFLHRLVAGHDGDGVEHPSDRGFDMLALSEAFANPDLHALPAARIAGRTSWSCHHGVARWSAECPDATDGRWKGPLRSALDRLASGIDAVTAGLLRREARAVDPLAARDAYIDVVDDVQAPEEFARHWLGRRSGVVVTERFLGLMEAQRWRLAMFQSDAWFWDDPVRFETKQVLLAAARAARLLDGIAGTTLEQQFGEDLTLFNSPARGLDGYAIYVEALGEVGQPAP